MQGNNKIKLIIAAISAVIVIAVVALIIILTGKTEPVIVPASSDISSSTQSPDQQSSLVSSGSENNSSELVSSAPEIIPLDVTSPKPDVTVYKDSVTIKGSADQSLPLYVNEQEIHTDANGIFAYKVELSVGNNYITVSQGEYKYSCVVRYRKTVILEAAPTQKLTLDGGDKLTVKVRALANSTVTATFNGKTINLSEEPVEKQEEYSDYYGSFEMPINYEADKNYGKITYKAVSKAGTGRADGSVITVRRTQRPIEEDYYMPTGKNYIDVGHTYIAEVVCRSAETMNIDDDVDYSRPTNNYLPKGTVDYCSSTVNSLYVDGETLQFRTLRYGKQLYLKTSSTAQNIIIYNGDLPDTNRVNVASFSSEGRHSTLTLDVDWKAPFYFDLYPQKYRNDGKSHLDYTVSDSTFTYVDITFCYAGEFEGELDLTDNKIFERYDIIKNESDNTLRLYLKKQGKFYGWSAEYNSDGQLVFSFLNPVELTTADNEYGYSLEGVTILVDAGHGGNQSGTDGFKSGNYEKVYTLLLAKKLEEKLQALGATVIMTRSDDSTVEAEERMNMVRDKKPDYVISIHRNASSSTAVRGFNSYHFNAFSADAAELIYTETEKKSLYELTKWSGVKWHYFFLARCTECPSVLTENGYMTNPEEYYQIIDEDFNDKCADALVDGIFAYFKSIQ